uniref:Uncharacterized protein n=1 Tax=Picea glauca TaxID=3330 RepID=A0A101M5T5_PICGL|nr:hypothetical protein ABT39_MTgene1234 [Picea glauca]
MSLMGKSLRMSSSSNLMMNPMRARRVKKSKRM